MALSTPPQDLSTPPQALSTPPLVLSTPPPGERINIATKERIATLGKRVNDEMVATP